MRHITILNLHGCLFLLISILNWQSRCATARQNQQNDLYTQQRLVSLCIHSVWLESSPCTLRVANNPRFLYRDSEDSDQTGRPSHLIGFAMLWLRFQKPISWDKLCQCKTYCLLQGKSKIWTFFSLNYLLGILIGLVKMNFLFIYFEPNCGFL